MYRLIISPNPTLIGALQASIEEGHILTFPDGTVFCIKHVFRTKDDKRLIASNDEYQLTFELE